MALSYTELKALLEKPSTANRRTDDELKQAATNYYDPIYNTQTLSAQQQADQTNAAYDSQLNALGADYDKQRRNAQAQTQSAKYSADRQALSRGMGRSSYNNATLALLDKSGNQQLAEIGASEGTARAGIEANKALTTQQLAQTLAGLQTDRAKNIAAYQDQLRDSDYQKWLAEVQYRNELEQMLANYQVDLEKYGLVGGGAAAGGGRSGGRSAAPASTVNGLLNTINGVVAANSTAAKAKTAAKNTYTRTPAPTKFKQVAMR